MKNEIEIDAFLELARTRRSTRHFENKPVPPELLEKCLEAARWAPSGFNMQPTHFFVVTEQSLKEKLYPACINQRQILEAGAIVVFTGDRRAAENNFELMLKLDKEAGAINEEYEKTLRWSVPISFSHKPFGLGWVWKAAAGVFAGRFTPIPRLQAVYKNYWLAKQASLCAMNFMLAAHAAGLSTCPMEGFSEPHVRRALKIPRHHSIILIVPVGYADNSGAVKTRFPLVELTHFNQW